MEIKNISFSFDDKRVLKNVSCKLQTGKMTTFIGANGSGKTTLLRILSRALAPADGEVLLDGKNISQYKVKEYARLVAMVHQKNHAPSDLTVRSLVSYGRVPHSGIFGGLNAKDKEKIQWAMEATEIESLANRPIGTLSGGQRQRAFISMALAQDTKVLLLDEATTYLDLRYQVELLRLLRQLNQGFGITIIMVLHDINQAIAYSDEIVALKQGEIILQGKPKQVISSKTIEDIYAIALPVREQDGMLIVPAI